MGNRVLLETSLIMTAVRRIRDALPSTWVVEADGVERAVAERSLACADGVLTVSSPGRRVRFLVEVKGQEWGRNTARLAVAQIRATWGEGPALLVTRYAGPALREACQEAGISYVDESGWLYLRDDQSGLFVSLAGQAKPPPALRRDSAMSRLDGPGASAVIRALWRVRTPIGVRALAEEARVSAGTSAKVLPPLAQYGAIERAPRGGVLDVDRRLLLERWTQDYGVYTTNPEVQWFLAARGPTQAYADLLRLQSANPELRVANTGYLAVLPALPEGVYPVIPDTLMSLYAPDPFGVATVLNLRPAARHRANVVIMRPRDESLIDPYQFSAPLSQALADLMTMGGRFPELAEQVVQEVLRRPLNDASVAPQPGGPDEIKSP